MAENGGATGSSEVSESLEISENGNGSLSCQPTLVKDHNLISYLRANKSKLSWSGTFQQLLRLTEERLGLSRDSLKVSVNETKKTIKTEQVTLNWFYSTGTLQVQGPEAASCRSFLTKLLDAESKNEDACLRPPLSRTPARRKIAWLLTITWKRNISLMKLCLSLFSTKK